MTRSSALIRRFSFLVVVALVAAGGLRGDDRRFTTSPTLSTEATTLVQLLEGAHYNRDAVHSSDYAQIIPDYMTALDGQHLLFLEGDKTAFLKLYGDNVYFNIEAIGNLDAAYKIFYAYENRSTARINWIFDELKKDVDYTVDETYRADRSKSEWPATTAEADDLWRKRLKFELLAEILNKKTPAEARDIVRKRYERMLKNVGEIDGSDLAELFLSSAAGLYDPHSTYFSADTFEDFGIQMKLKLVGIGALLGMDDDLCQVKEIVPGGPADLGHQLKPGDKIISVTQEKAGTQEKGEPVEIIGMKMRKIVELIRGEKGTKVHLLVQPANATDSASRKEIVITRDIVKLNSARARAAVFQVPGKDGQLVPLGVITLPAFYNSEDEGDTDADKSSASEDVAKLLVQLKQTGIKGLVLDLRHNGGGFLNEAIDLTGLFIHRGPVVQVKDYANEIQVDSEKEERLAYEGPMAVLVDRFSASASEIVAGALQNYGRAIVLGDSSTHGKGTVQTVLEMKNLNQALAAAKEKTGAAKITIQKFYLPDGASTQLKGVVPDIVMPSINDFLPIGESDLPHALPWDHIPSSYFGGSPIDAKVLAALRQTSLERQQQLDEFAYLRKNVDWFKARQAQKLISLNLEERRKQKVEDDAFKKETEARKDALAKNDYTFKEFRLGPPLPPKIVEAKPADAGGDAKPPEAGAGTEAKGPGDIAAATKPASADGSDDDDETADEADADSYTKVDVPLREALRVVDDAILLGTDHRYWASDHPPLAVSAKG